MKNLQEVLHRWGRLTSKSKLFYVTVAIALILLGILIGYSLQTDSESIIIISAILTLVGTVVGALIAAGAQHVTSRHERRNQLRLAAIDTRLEKHQEAYTHWRNLFFNLDKKEEERHSTIMECQDWWIKNCIYLEPKPREAFLFAFKSAWVYESLKRSKNNKAIMDCEDKIREAGKIILEAVSLPLITEELEQKGFIENQGKESQK